MDMNDHLVESDSHHAAVLASEVRCLVRTLRTYRVLSREQLAELSGAKRWPRGHLREAVEAAVRAGSLRRRGRGFVELPLERR
jgi:hypothetical protein